MKTVLQTSGNNLIVVIESYLTPEKDENGNFIYNPEDDFTIDQYSNVLHRHKIDHIIIFDNGAKYILPASIYRSIKAAENVLTETTEYSKISY